MRAVIDGAKSEVLEIACLESPAGHAEALKALGKLRAQRQLDAVYNPNYLSWPHYAEARSRMEWLAQQNGWQGLAGMERLVLHRGSC